MEYQGTSTIVQYERDGDTFTAFYVQRAWHRGAFVETARWRVPFSSLRRELAPAGTSGPLGYGRDDLIAAGFIKPIGFGPWAAAQRCLSLHP